MENYEIDSKNGIVIVSINPKIYSLDIVYSAAYIFTEKCYVLLDGDPLQEIIAELRPKSKDEDLKKIGMEFNNELINYANYDSQSRKNVRLREILLQRAMLTNLAPSKDANQPIPMQNAEYLEKEAKPWKSSKETKDEENNNRKEEEPSATFV